MTLLLGDCLEVMPTLEAGSVDAVVTDPPAGIAFMGKTWDRDKGGRTQWVAWMTAVMSECLRVLKPGGWLVCWSLPRTSHWTAWAIEDAGFKLTDVLMHVFASGFPKGRSQMKPAYEPWILARKPGPLRELAIDACRIPTSAEDAAAQLRANTPGAGRYAATASQVYGGGDGLPSALRDHDPSAGRWPANVILTDQDWYTLRDDVGQQPRDLIASYFEAQGLGVDDVPGVREGVRDHAGMGTGRAPEILLAPVQLEGFAGWEAGWDASSSRVDPTDAGLGSEGNGVGVSRLEGRPLVRPERLRERGGVDPDGSGARTGRVDGPEDRQGQAVSPGAPAGDGDDARPAIGAPRGSASPQRREGRQQSLEPVPTGPVESHAGAPDGRPRAGASPRASDRAGGRERGVTVPLDLIPVGWRRYFRFSHSTAIFDGDTPGVVGGGTVGASFRPGDRAVYTDDNRSAYGSFPDREDGWSQKGQGYGDSGTYSRFFLLPKAARSEREPVLGGLATRGDLNKVFGDVQYVATCEVCQARLPNATVEHCGRPVTRVPEKRPSRANHHPTVKPLDLMRHLVRLVTPTGGICLDPFAGSGTTALACELEGFPWIAIEREPEYVQIIEARLNGTQRGLGLPA